MASLGSSSFKKQAARFERTTACQDLQAEEGQAMACQCGQQPLNVLVFGLHHGAVVQSPSESQLRRGPTSAENSAGPAQALPGLV